MRTSVKFAQFTSGEEAIKHLPEAWPHLMIKDILIDGGLDGVDTSLEIMDRFRSKKRQPLKVYTDIGRYDIGMLIPMAAGLHELLLDKGYEHQYMTWNEGHSWCNWREHLGVPLGWFFGGDEGKR